MYSPYISGAAVVRTQYTRECVSSSYTQNVTVHHSLNAIGTSIYIDREIRYIELTLRN